MSIPYAFDRLMAEFNLKPADFYFLDLIPLIEILWADGKNQPGELRILYQCLMEHIAYLDQSSGSHAISVNDANDFLDRFAHRKPSGDLLSQLRALSAHASESLPDAKRASIFEYCLDIAAACTTRYPYELRNRIIDEEKKLLQKLFFEFNIATDTVAPFNF